MRSWNVLSGCKRGNWTRGPINRGAVTLTAHLKQDVSWLPDSRAGGD
jgi:hypothetical protein